MSAATRPDSDFWRVMSAPIGAAIIARITRRPSHTAIIARAALPAPLADLVCRVVARTRLSYSERADVARELCSHFTDTLAAGAVPGRAAGVFGDPRTAAVLIRRAKIRARPLLWHAFHRVRQALAVMVVVCGVAYAWLAIRYYRASPNIPRNYLADLNAACRAVPEADRAWPIYRRALLARTPHPKAERVMWGPVWPGEPGWDLAVQENAANRGAIELVRSAVQRPALACELTTEVDRELDVHFDDRSNEFMPADATRVEFATFNTMVQVFRLEDLANLLVHDACIAVERKDGSAVVRDLSDLVGLAGQLRQMPMLSAGHASLWVFTAALDTLDDTFLRAPDLLRDADLAGVAHRLGSFADADPSGLPFDSERDCFLDYLQRFYTDEGAGRGRLTSDGVRMLGQSLTPPILVPDPRRLLEPVRTAITLPGRREILATFEAALTRAREEAALPVYLRPGCGPREPRFFFSLNIGGGVWLSPSQPEFFLPILRGMTLLTDRVGQHRDASLAMIALDLFKRRHGAYPESLGALTPGLLPGVPLDRYDGLPLKYALRGGRPLLYSVGNDRADDGGRVPPGRWGNERAANWDSPEMLKQKLSTPAEALKLRGDFVLWPPVRYDRNGEVIERK